MTKTKTPSVTSTSLGHYNKIGSKNLKMGFGSLIAVIALLLALARVPATSNWSVVGFVKTFFGSAQNERDQDTPTVKPSADLTKPVAPTKLHATFITSTTLNLIWDAGSDNVGVVAYDVYLNGSFNASTGGTTVTLRRLAPDTIYKVTILSRDAAGNRSLPLAPENKDRVFEITIKTTR